MTTTAPPINDKKEIFGWTMYDWANSAFSTTVVAVFLGPYLNGLVEGAANAQGMVFLGNVPIHFDSFFTFVVSASVLLQVTILPLLGALADYSHLRKKMMMFFSSLGAVATILMFFLTPGLHWFGAILFILANVAFGAAFVFYNAYLPEIASEDQRDHVSARGFAMGYLGGGILLVLNLILFLTGDSYGIGGAMAARISLASAGVWWLGFSFITFNALHSRHEPRPLPQGETYLSIGFSQLADLVGMPTRSVTILMLLPLFIPVLFFLGLDNWMVVTPAAGPIIVMIVFIKKKSKNMPDAMRYMVAYLLYNDGIQTVIVITAIYATVEINMPSERLIMLILMIQFVAFGGAYLFSYIASKLGAKKAIIGSLVVWSFITIYAWAGMTNFTPISEGGMPQAELEFWILGFVAALVLGGSQALSRSLFSQMIPKEQEAEFFSFYEVSERGTSWLGPFIFGIAQQATGSMRIGMLSVIIFFIAGLILLPLVNVEKAIEQGKNATKALSGAGD